MTFPDSVVLSLRGPLRTLSSLRLFSSFSIVLGDYEENRAGGHTDAVAALRRSLDEGVLRAVTGGGDVEVGFRVDALPDRPELCAVLASALGWRNDPRSWQVNVVRRGKLLLAQVGALHNSKRFPALERIPASTTPVVAALLLQLLKPRPGDTVYDPFCGAGTLLVEASATGPELRLIGSDASGSALAAADVNRRALFPNGTLLRADASRIPLRAGSVQRVVGNLPFGKRVGSHAANVRLYPLFLAELNRILTADGRAVFLTEEKKLFRAAVEKTRNVRLLREVQITTGGLHPGVFVLERTRGSRRKGKPPKR